MAQVNHFMRGLAQGMQIKSIGWLAARIDQYNEDGEGEYRDYIDGLKIALEARIAQHS